MGSLQQRTHAHTAKVVHYPAPFSPPHTQTFLPRRGGLRSHRRARDQESVLLHAINPEHGRPAGRRHLAYAKSDTVFRSEFSYQKKAPKQVWKDGREEFGNYLWRVLNEETLGETKWEHTILEKCFTSKKEALTTLVTDIITPSSKYKGTFFLKQYTKQFKFMMTLIQWENKYRIHSI